MRPRWQKVFSDLGSNRTRSLLVIASITIGLFAIGVIATLYLVISEDMRAGYSSSNPANLFVSTGPIDEVLVDHIGRLEGVGRAEGAGNFRLRLAGRPGEWIELGVKAVPDLAAMQINQVGLLEGAWPSSDHEIVFEQSKLSDTHARLGDKVVVELPSGKTRQMTLVGVVQDQTIGVEGGSGGFFTAPVQGYVIQDSLEWLGQEQPDLFNTLYVTLDHKTEDLVGIDHLAVQVRDRLEKNGVPVFNTIARSSYAHPNQTLVDAIIGVLFVLGLLVVCLSGFLITNTLQALLDQQMEQVGVMKTVGASQAQIASVYMVLILIFGLLAVAIAVPLANQTAFRLLDLLAGQVNISLQGDRVIPEVVGLQIILALLVPQLAAFLPIWQGTRISVRAALSGIRDNAVPRRSRFDHWITGIQRLSRPMRISLRNTFRRKGRLLLTLTTLSLGGAVFIATFNVQISMGNYIDLIAGYFLADVNVSFGRPYRTADIEQQLAEVPGVAYVEGWTAARSQMIQPDGSTGESVDILAPPAGSPLVNPVVVAGRWIQPGDHNALVLTDHFHSNYPDVRIGDTLRLRINGRDTDWVVVGFFQLAGKVSGLLGYTNYDYLAGLTGQTNRATSFRIVAAEIGLDRTGQEHMARQIETHLRQNGYSIADIATGASLSTTASEGFAILTAFLLFLAGLTALVGSIGLTGTMSMNVMERTREIGVLRAIGADNPALMKMVIVEGMLIGVLSWLLACLLAFPISKVMADSISLALFDSPSNIGFTATGFAIWLVIVMILSVLASAMPARKAANLTIREVLAYE